MDKVLFGLDSGESQPARKGVLFAKAHSVKRMSWPIGATQSVQWQR